MKHSIKIGSTQVYVEDIGGNVALSITLPNSRSFAYVVLQPLAAVLLADVINTSAARAADPTRPAAPAVTVAAECVTGGEVRHA